VFASCEFRHTHEVIILQNMCIVQFSRAFRALTWDSQVIDMTSYERTKHIYISVRVDLQFGAAVGRANVALPDNQSVVRHPTSPGFHRTAADDEVEINDPDEIICSPDYLPIRWAGLGVRGCCFAAPSARWTSAASTTELTSVLLLLESVVLPDNQSVVRHPTWPGYHRTAEDNEVEINDLDDICKDSDIDWQPTRLMCLQHQWLRLRHSQLHNTVWDEHCCNI